MQNRRSYLATESGTATHVILAALAASTPLT
jgi:hypothetical protein